MILTPKEEKILTLFVNEYWALNDAGYKVSLRKYKTIFIYSLIISARKRYKSIQRSSKFLKMPCHKFDRIRSKYERWYNAKKLLIETTDKNKRIKIKKMYDSLTKDLHCSGKRNGD